MKIITIRDAKKIRGKRVFVRADFNVPIKDGKIKDDFKIVASLPTIRFLLRHKCRIIIGTHLGRPLLEINKLSKEELLEKYSTFPLAKRLSDILGRQVDFASDATGFAVESKIHEMKEGDILLLENLRFHKGEEDNNKLFARRLSRLADIYVNNAFGVSHRAHASVCAIKKYLPAYAGLLIEAEVTNLNKILHPKKPLLILIGGLKMATKLQFIKKLSAKADHILIGGAMANNFLFALNYEIGQSLIDKKDIKLARSIADFHNYYTRKKILLPIDAVVKTGLDSVSTVKSINHINKNDIILDIGPRTIKFYAKFIKKANTIIWNGPMGKFEDNSFKYGTLFLGQVIASRSSGKAFGVVGGGETLEALKMTKMLEYVDWASTGGGAMIAFLSGNKMPGLKGIVKR